MIPEEAIREIFSAVIKDSNQETKAGSIKRQPQLDIKINFQNTKGKLNTLKS